MIANVSRLGFGCMRLPLTSENPSDINTTLAEAMIDQAYEAGVNYFDTAWGYHGGESEPFIGKVLSKYPRDSFFLASKLPTWKPLLQTPEDVETIFLKQLERCQVEYFDYYLAHNLTVEHFENFEKVRAFDTLLKLKEQGKIKHIGFSFHDNPKTLEYILASHPWEFAQIQLNYVDWNATLAGEQYELLRAAGLPIIIMEPLRGGSLATLNEEARALLLDYDSTVSVPSWGIRFAGSLEGVMTVLSGMSTPDQVADNIKTCSSPLTPFNEIERTILEKAKQAFLSSGTIACTGCNYCMPCPQGVQIPRLFMFYNHYQLNARRVSFDHNIRSLYPQEQADNCISCGECLTKCPQAIEIPSVLKAVDALVHS